MRPYVVFHDDPAEIIEYFDKPDAEPIGGTVPYLGYQEMIRRFDALSNHVSPRPFLHLTLSLPKGISATKTLWVRIVKTTINAFGLDPDATPWFAARHRDKDCDHIHVAISRRDFGGRLWELSLDRIKSDRIHKHLCAMLGLPAPAYFDPDATPCLTPVTPTRNLKDRNRRRLFQDLTAVFQHAQPETITSLSAALSRLPGGFEVTEVRNRHGVNSLLYAGGDHEIYGGKLGTAWEPRFVKARLAFCRILRRCRYDLQMNNIIEIFRRPGMENCLDRTITAAKDARIAASRSDRLRSADENTFESGGPLSTDQPADGTGGSKGNPGRETGRIANITETDLTNLRDAAPSNDESHPGTHNNDRNCSQSRDGAKGRHGNEAEQYPDDAEHTPRLTFGGLLGRVCAIAKRRPSGWKANIQKDSKVIAVVFDDLSSVVVSAEDVEIQVDGKEAQVFTGDYCAAWLAYQNEDVAPQMDDYSGPEM